MRPEDSSQLILYSYWRSSAAYRVRIALHLKGLSFKTIPVHLVKQGGEQNADVYRAINPQGLVPAISHDGQVLTQSLAICEYLDACFKPYPLLPAAPLKRARVKSLVLQIACEVHPLNNLRVMKYLKGKYGEAADVPAWMSHWMGEGFTAIERQLSNGPASQVVSNGGRPGLFECFLIPQVYNADRFGVDMSEYPLINEIVTCCRSQSAFINAAPENQPDAEPL
jgi:maleylacetoacetate isomerase